MSTAMIYNAFGKYEDRDGELGLTLTYAGIPFWLPYQKVTYFPNWNFRELDHDKSTGERGQFVPQVYLDVRVTGDRIVEELTMKQVPRPNRDMGIIKIEGTPTGRMLKVPAGTDAESNQKLTAEVAEVTPTPQEIATGERLCKAYKEAAIAEYFQSKRQRMSGGQGQLQPAEQIRLFMEELGVKDLDAVENHQAIRGMDPTQMAAAMAMAIQIMQAQQAEKQLEEATRP